jgi:hypothetical protein
MASRFWISCSIELIVGGFSNAKSVQNFMFKKFHLHNPIYWFQYSTNSPVQYRPEKPGAHKHGLLGLSSRHVAPLRQRFWEHVLGTETKNHLLTTCYIRLSQFNILSWVTSTNNSRQLEKITALLQLVVKLAASLLWTHLVDKLWVTTL